MFRIMVVSGDKTGGGGAKRAIDAITFPQVPLPMSSLAAVTPSAGRIEGAPVEFWAESASASMVVWLR